ncbi:MAG: DHHW family protein [Cellulosilyticaceae bacterium]
MIDEIAEINVLYEAFSNLTHITTLDLVAPLTAHNSTYIYYQTDHHWTTLGTYIGYKSTMEQLKKA